MLDPVHSRGRQHRVLEAVRELNVDAVVVGASSHAYYFSGHLASWLHQACVVVLKNGRSWLCAANKAVENTAVDEPAHYEAQWMATLRPEQPAVVAEKATAFLKSNGVKKIGADASSVTSQLVLSGQFEAHSIEPTLWQLRRRKDPDELELLRKAIDCTRAMHARAREIIRPGVLEIDVFNELHAAAVKVAGEPLSSNLGNDFACGAGGGPPRHGRWAQEGELYILDLGPCYRGYFADNCRTYAVSEPTRQQRDAAEHVRSCFPIVERLARPGVRCRELYEGVIQHLTERSGRAFAHHLGHGIGLWPHEYPHLNPNWDDVLMEGEVFAAEPGLYAPELRGGIRIENNYLVTASGVEALLAVPMEL
jgi:Xaa-Pro dipeptidase